jgi:hypothetical protein
MPTSKEYRQQARECLELASASEDVFTIQAMTELAEEFTRAAERLEREIISAPDKMPKRRLDS